MNNLFDLLQVEKVRNEILEEILIELRYLNGRENVNRDKAKQNNKSFFRELWGMNNE